MAVLQVSFARAMSGTSNLFERPVLAIDPGMHTARITRASADRDGCWVVTGSHDKTVRAWSITTGDASPAIRLPAGPGNVGEVNAVAINPDGTLIAAGGWTRRTDTDQREQIYLFNRDSGALVWRIENLPSIVLHLAFSPDGARLAVVLGQGEGLRIYAEEHGWGEIARDDEYGAESYGVAFAPDGRLATTCLDGFVRLYTKNPERKARPELAAYGGRKPFGIAFSAEGKQLAIGYADSALVYVLHGETLAVQGQPDLHNVELHNGSLSAVCWSRNGQTLFAGGLYWSGRDRPVFAWSEAGAGKRHVLAAGRDNVMSLMALPDGDLLVASSDPWLARLAPDGTPRWQHLPPNADFSEQFDNFACSFDGTRIGFGFDAYGESPAYFDVEARRLILSPPSNDTMIVPCQEGLPIKYWYKRPYPTLNGKVLPLDDLDNSQSLAVHPNGDRFVLGTHWSLRAFSADGGLLWRRSVPAVVWAVNITGNGLLLVAAYADGTIRWHRMTDGVELLALMPLADRTNWVAWTPEGFYAATAGAHGLLRWHVNRGWDAAADSVPVANIPGSYRPAVLPLVLQELETPRALGLAVMAEHGQEIMLRTKSYVPAGAQLHLLAVGISAYNEDYAKSLRLHYADRDASDLASAIVGTQGSLYHVRPQVLLDKDASKSGILRALKIMRAGMQVGAGNDLAVVHFSGHGAMVDQRLYLLPVEVDARDDAGIQANGLSADDLKGELLELAQYGRVLVLLDACHSGAMTMNGTRIAIDADALRTGLAAANVTVLTSCRGSETSEEHETWRHGAFTKALLDAFNDPAADINHNGLISTTGLANYLSKHVSALTEGKQTPGLEVRFDTTLFASAS